MRNSLMAIFVLLVSSLYGQTESKDWVYEYNGGKKYIVHIAQAGNTLWGLHQTYGVSVNEITASNPGIEKGLKEGFRYLIPKGVADIKVPNGTLVREHEVVKGETAFSIAKKYNSSVDALLNNNPGIDKGLKIGQVLKVIITPEASATPIKDKEPSKVPAPSITFSDSILVYEVKDKETLYTISKRFMVPVSDLQNFNSLKSTNIKAGDVLRIPLKKESVKQVEVREVKPVREHKKIDEELIFKPKSKYNIAVLLSFGLNDKSNTALKNLATEFYMGVELAIDSLERKGFSANVKVIDIPLDSVGIMKVLNGAEMKTMDLVFAPLVPNSADIVGKWCKLQKIRMVCPSACNTALLKDNPFVYSSIATDMTQLEILAKYSFEQYKNAQIVLINPGNGKDKELYDAYRKKFMALSKQSSNLKLIEATSSDFSTFIRKTGETVLVYPSRDKGSVLTFINNLHKAAGKYSAADITVLGVKEWGGYDDISGYYKTRYHITWASTNDLNYSLPDTKTLLRLFRIKYRTDMSKVSAHGFDVFYYFTTTLLMKEKVDTEVINAFDMREIAPGSGYENQSSFILKHEDYELIRIGVFNE